MSLGLPKPLVIWWLSQEAATVAVTLLKAGAYLPPYIEKEVRSRCGRPSRGRLWVPPHIDLEQIPWDDDKPLAPHAALCGGIVIEMRHVARVACWPGFITSLQMDLWRGLKTR